MVAFAGSVDRRRTRVGDSVKVPFLFDADVHARFLLALPLLIVAELVVYQRMRLVVGPL